MSNKDAYDKKYQSGYGIYYPDGHVIRFYEKFLKYELGIDGSLQQKLLDFGCGNGTHLAYFKTKGFDVYGIDISETAIKTAKDRFPEIKDKIAVTQHHDSIMSIFTTKFDVIFSNQTLYFLSNTELNLRLSQMYEMLLPGGIVYFTMMGAENYYYSLSKPVENGDGLRSVTVTGRLNQTLYINFTHNIDELEKKFGLFETYYTGFYDCSAREGSTFHYQFIGRKSSPHD